jgi:uncharacterized protein (TIGR00725 family)
VRKPPRRPVVGVMGPGAGARPEDLENARRLGAGIARAGWVLLSGGQAVGVMDAASRGAASAGGLVVGVLPGDDPSNASEALDVAIVTGMGSARNNVNVLSSDVVVACGMGAGTASEVALALKAGKPVVLLGCGPDAEALFAGLGPVTVAATPEDALAAVQAALPDLTAP